MHWQKKCINYKLINSCSTKISVVCKFILVQRNFIRYLSVIYHRTKICTYILMEVTGWYRQLCVLEHKYSLLLSVMYLLMELGGTCETHLHINIYSCVIQ